MSNKQKMKKLCSCKMCKNLKKSIKEEKEGKSVPYESFEAWEKKRDKWVKEHPIQYKIEQTYYSIRRFVIRIIDFFRYDIKIFFQRGAKGWSDRDWWSFPFYVSTVIVGCLKRLKKDGHGLPTWGDGKTEKQASKEWDDILDNIIYTFEMGIKIGNGDVDYIPSTQKDAEKARRIYRKIHRDLKKKHPEFSITKVLTAKESLKLEKGFDLLKKWFFHLWD